MLLFSTMYIFARCFSVGAVLLLNISTMNS